MFFIVDKQNFHFYIKIQRVGNLYETITNYHWPFRFALYLVRTREERPSAKSDRQKPDHYSPPETKRKIL